MNTLTYFPQLGHFAFWQLLMPSDKIIKIRKKLSGIKGNSFISQRPFWNQTFEIALPCLNTLEHFEQYAHFLRVSPNNYQNQELKTAG